MRATARLWRLAALPVVLTGWAVVVDRPVLLVGAAGTAAWVLAMQGRFLQATTALRDRLAVDQRLSSSRPVSDTSTFLSLTVDAGSLDGLSLRVDPEPPVAADSSVDPVTLEPGDSEGDSTSELAWPVAGSFTVDAPTVTVRDRLGLFEQTLRAGPVLDVSVQPPRTSDVHVGEGGDPVGAGFGEHDVGRADTGIEPEEVREYTPGDALRQIDWKATARLHETHVREFTAQSDRTTALVVDHRASMAAGRPGETKFALAREIALSFVESADGHADRIGCYTVGEAGITGLFEPAAAADHYARIRRQLVALEPAGTDRTSAARTTDGRTNRERTNGDGTNDEPSTDEQTNGGRTNGDRTDGDPWEAGGRVARVERPSPERTRTTRRRLAGSETPFARRLEPFYDRPTSYVRPVAEQPLFATVRSVVSRSTSARWTVLVTDDERRTELREAVKVARRRGPVLAFVTPTVLFEPGGLGDLEAAVDRYVDFERFRRDLAALDGVTAFEVGPADRLEAVVSAARERRTRRGERR